MRFWRICRRRFLRRRRLVKALVCMAAAATLTDYAWFTLPPLWRWRRSIPFVNLEPNLQPEDLVSIENEVPDELEIGRLDPRNSPSNLVRRERNSAPIWDELIRAGRTLAPRVPLAAIPWRLERPVEPCSRG